MDHLVATLTELFMLFNIEQTLWPVLSLWNFENTLLKMFFPTFFRKLK